ncbi:MAG: aromatic amino acid lyase, partial [Sneathiella sp.]|uniref:aromatic amino acid lyase n=1 Tax=Sneathiella sp. TaxID=1964365 RepID=UPI003001E837
MSIIKLNIKAGHLSLTDLRTIYEGPVNLELDPECWPAVAKSADAVQSIVDQNKTVYGINTGFGRLAQEVIPTENLKDLQKNLVLSHSTGIGPNLPDSIVRLILAMKAT